MAPKVLLVDDNQELLSLLQLLLEETGYRVLPATRGKQALELARSERPVLAIIDLLLPDILGLEVAEVLRREQPEVALMFISGVYRGARLPKDALQRLGVVAYFEKPFDAQKLLEEVGKILPVSLPEPTASSMEEAFQVELDVDVHEDQPQDAMELTGRIKITGGGNISAELRGANLTAVPLDVRTLASQLRPTRPSLEAAAPSQMKGPSRRGELRDNLPSLINAFFLAKETGELGVQRGKVKKLVYFERGQPVFALSNLAADRFGHFLVRVGKITREQLEEAAEAAAATRRRTGDVLVERGLLKETERLYFVGQQVKAIIYSLFAWEDGQYVMSFREGGAKEPIKLDVHPANLVLRGVKKLYKQERLHRLLKPHDRLGPSHQSCYELAEVELERWETELLTRIDGTTTVEQLVAAAHRPEASVYSTLVSLMALSFVERQDVSFERF